MKNNQLQLFFKKGQLFFKNFLKLLQEFYQNHFKMEHSSEEIFQLLNQKPSLGKSSQQLAHLIRILFGNPQTLTQKINDLCNKNVKDRNKQFDIVSIQKLYQNVKKLSLDKEVAKCLGETISRFQEPNKLNEFVKSQKEMKYFFILILWEELFTLSENKLLLFRVINLINACPGYTSTLQNWAKELDEHYITLMMDELHQYLQLECEKLRPEIFPTETTEIITKALWLNIYNISKFIGIFYRSNNEVKRVPKQVFVFSNLSKYFDPIIQYKLHYHKQTKLNMLDFPYLMKLDYKYQLLKIESILEQKLNIQKSMQTGISGMINAMMSSQDFSLQGLLYLYFEVNRQNILDDSMEKLGKVKNLKSPLRISFVGQEGSDEGGVKNQYFQLITKEIFNPYLDMFLPKHNGRVYWFNGFSFQPPIRFQFVGMLLGLAIYNSVHLNIPFPNILYKKLLNKSEEDEFSLQLLDDLFDIEPDIQKGLKQILEEKGPLDELELYFTIELESFGQRIVEQLVEDGRQIKVTQDNKMQYCQLYADYLLNKNIKKQFIAFKKGYYRVVSGRMIELFDSIDLKTIIYGNDIIDFKQLEESTVYEGGYTNQTLVVKNLWQLLHSLDIEDKKAFLIFTTGSDRVPIQGLKALNFVIQKHSNTSNLPTAHTCFNIFLLPQYETKEKLQKMIHLILKNNQGFGLI